MSLDLSLPEPPAPRRGTGLQIATLVLALAAVVLLVIDLVGATRPASPPPSGAAMLDPGLAEMLEKRTLWREAAAIWEDRAATAEDLFRAGKCRLLAGDAERAARNLLAAEAAGLTGEPANESSRLILEAYAMLGKFDVRNAALEERTGGTGRVRFDIVARVGGEPITREELQDAVRDEELGRLMVAGGLSRDALDRAVAARNADPKRLLPTLNRLLSRRALALEALSGGLGERPDLARRIREVRQGLLGSMLVEERLLAGVTATEAEIEDHYKAHPERYTDPEAARISVGPTPEELKEVPGWHETGAAFPDGLGRSAEADALLRSLEPGETSDRAVRIGDKDMFLSLIERRPARLIPFAEARDRVVEDLFARKRDETIQAVEAEARARHEITIVDEALKRAGEEAGALRR